MDAVDVALTAVPGLDVDVIASTCGDVVGSPSGRATLEITAAFRELSLFQPHREAGAGDLLVADGTNCRHQIHHGVERGAVRVAREAAALAGGRAS